jgi:hypothetical protein
MERNSAGQVIVKESGSLLLSIQCLTSTISINAYNRFLLDEREFTELVPTIDKDALINSLESQLFTANTNLAQEQINSRGGCNVGITNEQVVRNNVNRQKITFDTTSGGPYYNSIQTNGQPIYSLTEEAAILYADANSKRYYTFKATIKYRYRYIGQNTATKTTTRTSMRFYKDTPGLPGQNIGDSVDRTDNIAGTYNPKNANGLYDVTGLYTINLEVKNQGLGGLTDKIFVYLESPLSDFELVVYPESTFTVLPE